MKDIFIGKARHWLLFLVITACFWVTGVFHIHVSEFNSFIAITAFMAAVLVFIVILDYRPGDRVTREPLPDRDAE